VQSVQYDLADPDFPASLVDAPEPELPRGDWARVEVTVGGICGSDMHLFKPTTGPSPMLIPYVGFPMQLGHEIAGRVVEVGPDCDVAVGTAVAVDPVIACAARGIEPVCPKCVAGAASACTNVGSGVLTPGMGLGFTTGLGGGWSEQVVAHVTQLHPLPEGVDIESASLHEPLSIAVHGILRQPPQPGSPALVIGAGIIGLAAVAVFESLFPDSEVTVAARYPHQAEAARALGAEHIVSADETQYDAYAEIAGTDVVRSGDGAMLRGGYPYVVEAVGSEQALTDAFRVADTRGTVILLGAAGVSKVDMTPVWFKELTVAGSFCHAHDGGSHSIDTALELMASGAYPASTLVTHRFPLADVRAAIETAGDRAAGAIKVVLQP
jgi:L-iditol 2-dehydrogenase